MKPTKPSLPKVPQAPDGPPPDKKPWSPDWRWHVKTLGVIYAVLVVFYFAMSAFLSRLPPPYGLRHVSPEVTPWLKGK